MEKQKLMDFEEYLDNDHNIKELNFIFTKHKNKLLELIALSNIEMIKQLRKLNDLIQLNDIEQKAKKK